MAQAAGVTPGLGLRGLVGAAVILIAAAAVLFGLRGCDEKAAADVERVVIAGETFFLERAMDFASRQRGLMGRTHIEDDGGMLFVFPQPQRLGFWMKNCLIDIDILYLDGSGRVLSTYTMKAEPPQKEGESEAAYEQRLKSYDSVFPAQFAVELKPGTIQRLGVKPGDQISLDAQRLKREAR